MIIFAIALALLGGRIAWVKWQDAAERQEFHEAVEAFVADGVKARLECYEPHAGTVIDLAKDQKALQCSFRLAADADGYGVLMTVNSSGSYSPISDLAVVKIGSVAELSSGEKRVFEIATGEFEGGGIGGGGLHVCAIIAARRETLTRLLDAAKRYGVHRDAILRGRGHCLP